MTIDETLVKNLFELENRLANPMPETDIESLIADEFTEFGTSGRIYKKSDALKAIHSHPLVETALIEFNVTELDRHVILVTYISGRKDKSRGGIQRSLRSSIWKFIDGKWRIVFHQGTNLMP